MARSVRWSLLMMVAVLTVGWLAADSSALLAEVRNSNRTDTWEFTIPVRYIAGTAVDFDHGTSIDIHNDVGFGFGFGYNFNEKFNLNFEFAWTDANYKVEIASADNPPGNPWKATGELSASNSSFNFTYYIIPKTVTPYLSAAVGWTWVDSNIPNGPPQTGCWWDPWYGYICTSYQDTFEDDALSYGLGAGVRVEVTDTFFLRLGINENWQDFGGYSTNADVLSARLDIAWKF